MINQVTIQTGVHSPPSISYLSLLNESLSQAEVSFSKKVPFRFENVFRQESAFQQEGAFPFRKMLSAQHLLFLRSADAATCSEGVLA